MTNTIGSFDDERGRWGEVQGWGPGRWLVMDFLEGKQPKMMDKSQLFFWWSYEIQVCSLFCNHFFCFVSPFSMGFFPFADIWVCQRVSKISPKTCDTWMHSTTGWWMGKATKAIVSKLQDFKRNAMFPSSNNKFKRLVVFLSQQNIQLMVSCWFGLVVVWIPGIPLWKGLGFLGVPRFESQTTGPQTNN